MQPTFTEPYEGARNATGIPLLAFGDRYIHFAQFYGYPVCCHNYFWFDREKLLGSTTAEEEALGFLGTGYRPCPDCQKRPTAEVYESIRQNRRSTLPFPVQEDDFENGLLKPVHIDTLKGFTARLRTLGIEPERRLSLLMFSDTLRQLRPATADSAEGFNEEGFNPLFWQEGIAGGCNIVSYDGEDIRGIAFVSDAELRKRLIEKHNKAVRSALEKD